MGTCFSFLNQNRKSILLTTLDNSDRNSPAKRSSTRYDAATEDVISKDNNEDLTDSTEVVEYSSTSPLSSKGDPTADDGSPSSERDESFIDNYLVPSMV